MVALRLRRQQFSTCIGELCRAVWHISFGLFLLVYGWCIGVCVYSVQWPVFVYVAVLFV